MRTIIKCECGAEVLEMDGYGMIDRWEAEFFDVARPLHRCRYWKAGKIKEKLMMTKDQILEVSDCCHAGFVEYDVSQKDGSYKSDELYICNRCGKACKVLKLLVEKVK